MKFIKLFVITYIGRMKSIMKDIIYLDIIPVMDQYLTDEDIKEELHICSYTAEE